MPYNTRNILRDQNGNPIPQQFNAMQDTFEPLETMSFFGKSTDTKPSGNIKKGSTFFEIDTTNAYMYDGLRWVAI